MYTPVSPSDENFSVYDQPPAIGLPYHAKNQYHEPPQPVLPPVKTSNPWFTDLCDCSNCSLCCLACWLPCIPFGQIAEIVDEGSIPCIAHGAMFALVNFLTGCACVYSGFYRTKIRQQYGLEESPCNDYCVHCCCHACALGQEYRELEHRGFEVSIGWNESIQRNILEAEMVQSAPAMPAGMLRKEFQKMSDT